MFKKILLTAAFLAGSLFAQTAVHTPTLERNNTWTGNNSCQAVTATSVTTGNATASSSLTVNSTSGFTETFVSPFGEHEGYATDGTFHYLDGAADITKRNNDSTWSVVTTNASPFTGLTGTGFNHLGDMDYYNG